jgi:hypothetical protein
MIFKKWHGFLNAVARFFTLNSDETQVWLLNSPRRGRINILTDQRLGTSTVPSEMTE